MEVKKHFCFNSYHVYLCNIFLALQSTLSPLNLSNFSALDRPYPMLSQLFNIQYDLVKWHESHSAAAKSLQSCPTLCNPIDGSPPGSPGPGILQARVLEWVAISFSNAWKWKVKVKALSRVWLSATPWTEPTRLLRPWDFPGKSTGVGCHCLLWP